MSPPVQEQALQASTVLVVDDESGVRSVVRRMLELAGATVLEADGGEVALQTIQRDDATGRLDAVVTDLEMPGVHGSEVLAVLQACRPDLPVLAMSGRSAYVAGLAVPFLGKPFAESELVEKVATLVRSARKMRRRTRRQSADGAESRTVAGRHHVSSEAHRARTDDLMAALVRLRQMAPRSDP